jgi:hypothetical protein
VRPSEASPCDCGHPRDSHEHYRPGTDCALCPPGICQRYQRHGGRWFRPSSPAWLRKVLRVHWHQSSQAQARAGVAPRTTRVRAL